MNKYDEILKEQRKKIFLTAYSCGKGHLASAYSITEIIFALYELGVMKHNPKDPDWEQRDRLVLSKGHGSLALYTALARCGYFDENELKSFCQPNSRIGGEPNMQELPGIEATTGSLGHGLSIAVGMALAAKTDKLSNHIYVIVGDGECEEGSVWEAVMSANMFGLDNLTIIVDCNRIQKMGYISEITKLESWENTFLSFGCQVKHVDGHNPDLIKEVLESEWESGKTRVVLADTVKGKGVSIMEGIPNWHWRMPSKKELKVIVKELNISEEELEQCKKHI